MAVIQLHQPKYKIQKEGWKKFDEMAKKYGHSRAKMLRILAENFYDAVKDKPGCILWPPEFKKGSPAFKHPETKPNQVSSQGILPEDHGRES
jgi:hypothetical protein